MENEQTALRLPIRLVPRRGAQLVVIGFFVIFTGFAIFWMTMALTMLWADGGANDTPLAFKILFPAFGIPFIVVGIYNLLKAIVKMLPGSPAYHLELSPVGITTCAAFKRRPFAWSALTGFVVAPKTYRSKNGTRIRHWVVALEAKDDAHLADPSEAYKRSVIRIDPAEYGTGKAEIAAAELGEWLNQLRQDALDRRLNVTRETAIPPAFRGSVVAAGGGGSPSAMASTIKNQSVIER